jgi:hypothetical protein
MNETTRLPFDQTDAGKSYHRYQRIWQLSCTRHRARLAYASQSCDPQKRLHPSDGCELYAHNWHNCSKTCQANACAVITEIDRFRRFSTWRFYREKRESNLANHRDHIRDSEVGVYLWCQFCQGERP